MSLFGDSNRPSHEAIVYNPPQSLSLLGPFKARPESKQNKLNQVYAHVMGGNLVNTSSMFMKRKGVWLKLVFLFIQNFSLQGAVAKAPQLSGANLKVK